MLSACQVKICKNYWRKTKKENSTIHYFRFPKNELFKEKWTQATGLTVISVKNPRICSIHFSEDCYAEDWITITYNLPSYSKRLLKHDAIPTLHPQEEESSYSEREARQGEETEASRPPDSAVVVEYNEEYN